jgi:hypothetical protein
MDKFPATVRACGGQDPTDGSLADAVAEAEKFALDAAVSPARVLPGQLLDQLADLIRERWSSRVFG